MFAWFAIHHRDTGSALRKKVSNSDSGFAKSNYGYIFIFKFHNYLSFRVLRLIMANTTATIQNRTMTLGSDQPNSSKW